MARLEGLLQPEQNVRSWWERIWTEDHGPDPSLDPNESNPELRELLNSTLREQSDSLTSSPSRAFSRHAYLICGEMCRQGIDIAEAVVPAMLMSAVVNNDLSLTEEILALPSATVNCRGPELVTPLILSANVLDLELVASLIEHGAKVDAQEVAGFTALRVAVARNNTRTASLLIEHRVPCPPLPSHPIP